MTSTKAQLRREVVTARQTVTEEVRTAEAIALTRHISALCARGTVCAYVPVGSEPGSITMLDALHDAGVRVLLPIAFTGGDGTPMPLSWGRYRPGELAPARFGLLEPGGPRLAAAVLAEAGLVIVPALAVDRRGSRLGRGAGFYDRSLPLRDPAARLMAVVRDDELLDEIPAEPHDIRMTDVLTPGRGVVALG